MSHNGQTRNPFIIGVTGGSASGKTTVCQEIIQKLNSRRVSVIPMDAFYYGLGGGKQAHIVDAADYNFDHPGLLKRHFTTHVLNC